MYDQLYSYTPVCHSNTDFYKLYTFYLSNQYNNMLSKNNPLEILKMFNVGN